VIVTERDSVEGLHRVAIALCSRSNGSAGTRARRSISEVMPEKACEAPLIIESRRHRMLEGTCGIAVIIDVCSSTH
jgi:hypothetical protein